MKKLFDRMFGSLDVKQPPGIPGGKINRPGPGKPPEVKIGRPQESKPRELTPTEARDKQRFQFNEDRIAGKPEAKALQLRMDALTQQLLRKKLTDLGDPHVLKIEAEKLTADMRRGGYQSAAEDWMNKTEQLLG